MWFIGQCDALSLDFMIHYYNIIIKILFNIQAVYKNMKIFTIRKYATSVDGIVWDVFFENSSVIRECNVLYQV